MSSCCSVCSICLSTYDLNYVLCSTTIRRLGNKLAVGCDTVKFLPYVVSFPLVVYFMTTHSPSKKAPREKRRREDTGNVLQKKHKARSDQPTSNSSETQLRRSSRAGAGVGGHILQLERIGTAIEGSQHVLRPATTFSNDAAVNPVAPANSNSRPRKRVCTRSRLLFRLTPLN